MTEAFHDRPHAADPRLLTTPPHTPRPGRLVRGSAPADVWDRIEREGAPLVDGDGDGDERWYTWAHRGPARRVALIAGKLADHGTVDDVIFDRVPDTDVWTLTLRLPAAWRCTYQLSVDDGSQRIAGDLAVRRDRALDVTDPARHRQVHDWYALLAAAGPDPRARERFRGQSIAVGPAAPVVRATPPPAAPGRLIPAVGPRTAHWFVPAAVGADPAVLVMLDGDRRLADGVDALDAWLHTHTAPDTVVLLVGHGGMRERLADLTCNPDFVDDLRALVAAAPVPVTDDPRRTAVVGSSMGGLTALYAQCVAADRFGVSICQSASFWWPNAASGAQAEWLTRTIAASDARLDRVHLSVGLDEWVLTGPVRRMRDVLARRASVLDYEEFVGGHDAACWEASLPAVLDRLGFGAVNVRPR